MPFDSSVAGSLACTVVTGAAGQAVGGEIGQGADAEALSDGSEGRLGPAHDLAEPGISIMRGAARSPCR